MLKLKKQPFPQYAQLKKKNEIPKESPLVMEDLEAVTFLHLFPDSEITDNHELSPDCRCQPEQRDLEDLDESHRIKFFVSDEDSIYVVCEHHMIH